jgi:hypothetical protein
MRLTAAGRHLFNSGDPRKRGRTMPEVGGKSLAGTFSSRLAGIKQRIVRAHDGVNSAMGEIETELDKMGTAEKVLRSEAADLRNATNEILGNSPPEE